MEFLKFYRRVYEHKAEFFKSRLRIYIGKRHVRYIFLAAKHVFSRDRLLLFRRKLYDNELYYTTLSCFRRRCRINRKSRINFYEYLACHPRYSFWVYVIFICGNELNMVSLSYAIDIVQFH